MKRIRKKSNNKIILLLILLMVTIGYALMSTTLKINGLANLKGNTWDIHWDSNSINVDSGSVSAPNITLSDNNTKVNFSANLKLPGDYYEFTIDAVNAGTLDGMIDKIDTSIKNGSDETTTLPDYIHLTVMYEDGDEITRFHKLAKREDAENPTRETFLIRLEYDPDTEVLPDSNLNFNISYSIDYVQADNRAIDRNYVSLDGVTFNNAMLNLAYNANKNTIGSIDNIISNKGYEGYNLDITRTIKHVDRATAEQYNTAKNTLSSDELISLSKDAEEKELYPIATSSAVGDTNRANIDVYMWYDKPTQTIYYYSAANKIRLPKDVSGMFWGLSHITTLDVSGFDASKVTNMADMFRWCYSLQTVNFNGFDTSKSKSFSMMFYGDDELISLDLRSWDTHNVIYMNSLFEGCNKLSVIQGLSNFNTSKVITMKGTFSGVSVDSFDFSNWDTSNVTDMDSMFFSCDELTTLDVSSFDTSNVTDMTWMFSWCENLETIDISSFSTNSLNSADYMFVQSNNLKTIYAGNNWDNTKEFSTYAMFNYDTKLIGGNGTHYNENYDDKTYARIDEPGTPGYFTRKTN